jgi:hypothetical protein
MTAPPAESSIKGRAILFSEMTPPPGGEEAFNRWYNGHHTPSHVQGVPGFLSARRYKSDAGPHYMVIYDLDSPAALQTREYKTRKFTPDSPTKAMLASVTGFTRYVGEEISYLARPGDTLAALDADHVAGVFLKVPPDRADDFVAWCEKERAPMVLESPDWAMARHFRIVDHNPEPFTHVVLHYLYLTAALESDVLKRARNTPWRNRLAAEPWFKPHVVQYRAFTSRFRKSSP